MEIPNKRRLATAGSAHLSPLRKGVLQKGFHFLLIIPQ
jgi:hypothetical protein